MTNLLIIAVAAILRMVWAIHQKQKECFEQGEKFGIKKYLGYTWAKWVTHFVSAAALSFVVPEVMKLIHDQTPYKSLEEGGVSFLIGMFGYDIINLIIGTKNKMFPANVKR